MSIKSVESEIVRFLSSNDPEVLCISGPWGAGKTFTWNQILNSATDIALNDYAYVSLFGQSSLQDVRNAIFENTRPTKDDDESKVNRIKQLGQRISRQAAKHRSILKGFAPEGIVTSSERLMFASLESQIVCLDDLERAGEGLWKDVLGLANQLKEEKQCKVVLLLNSEAMDKYGAEFKEQIEKVADTFLEFEPTPTEAASIGVSDDAPDAETIRKHVKALSVRNIRTIKRIESASRRLAEILSGYDERILYQVTHTAALFVYMKYQPGDAPSEEFVQSYNRFSIDEENNDHPKWRSLLTDYAFGHVDELDLVVIDGVKTGFFDPKRLKTYADQKARSLELGDKDSSFQDAWDRYHCSFDDDQEEVLDQMATAFKKSIEAITPLNAASAAQFFKELGRPEQARELAEYYVQNRDEPQEFWNLKNSMFGSEIRDEDIREIFRAKYDSLAPPLEDPADILIRINKDSGFSRQDVERLAKVTEDEFYELLKAPHGKNLRRITTEIMRFGRRNVEGSLEHSIYERGNAALDRIAEESPMNKRRVKQHRSRS